MSRSSLPEKFPRVVSSESSATGLSSNVYPKTHAVTLARRYGVLAHGLNSGYLQIMVSTKCSPGANCYGAVGRFPAGVSPSPRGEAGFCCYGGACSFSYASLLGNCPVCGGVFSCGYFAMALTAPAAFADFLDWRRTVGCGFTVSVTSLRSADWRINVLPAIFVRVSLPCFNRSQIVHVDSRASRPLPAPCKSARLAASCAPLCSRLRERLSRCIVVPCRIA